MFCKSRRYMPRNTLCFCVMAVLFSGCTNTFNELKESAEPSGLHNDFSNLPKEYWTLDEKFLEISRLTPAFAGLYRNENGVVIALTQQSKLPAIQLAITQIFGNSFFSLMDSISTKQATYTFEELFSWMNALSQTLTDRNIVFTDIDEVQNRLVIGLPANAAREHITDLITDLGIPQAVVVFEDATPFTASVPLGQAQELSVQAVNDSLIGTVNPRTGGIQIDTPGTWCTLGFNASLTINGVAHRGFVTNSHCTGRIYAQDLTASVFKQPLNGGTIGKELKDNAGRAGSFCPARFDRCRYSDSAFIEYYDTVLSERKIAVTEREASNHNAPIYDIASFRKVRGDEDPIYYGQAFKTGARTGFTIGSIISKTCFQSYSNDFPSVGLNCQYLADYHSDGGDSGAPVSNSISGRLFGLNWGSNSDGNPIFSPMAGVRRDLGQLQIAAP